MDLGKNDNKRGTERILSRTHLNDGIKIHRNISKISVKISYKIGQKFSKKLFLGIFDQIFNKSSEPMKLNSRREACNGLK